MSLSLNPLKTLDITFNLNKKVEEKTLYILKFPLDYADLSIGNWQIAVNDFYYLSSNPLRNTYILNLRNSNVVSTNYDDKKIISKTSTKLSYVSLKEKTKSDFVSLPIQNWFFINNGFSNELEFFLKFENSTLRTLFVSENIEVTIKITILLKRFN